MCDDRDMIGVCFIVDELFVYFCEVAVLGASGLAREDVINVRIGSIVIVVSWCEWRGSICLEVDCRDDRGERELFGEECK